MKLPTGALMRRYSLDAHANSMRILFYRDAHRNGSLA